MVTMLLINSQPCLLFLICNGGSNVFGFFFLSELHLRKWVVLFLSTGKKLVLIITVTQCFALVRDLDSSRLLPIDNSIHIAAQLLKTITRPDCTQTKQLVSYLLSFHILDTGISQSEFCPIDNHFFAKVQWGAQAQFPRVAGT